MIRNHLSPIIVVMTPRDTYKTARPHLWRFTRYEKACKFAQLIAKERGSAIASVVRFKKAPWKHDTLGHVTSMESVQYLRKDSSDITKKWAIASRTKTHKVVFVR